MPFSPGQKNDEWFVIVNVSWRQRCKKWNKNMKTDEENVLNLELLEARLEMESMAASLGDGTTPISICHF